MKKCPYCGGDVEKFRGDCPHCKKNLDADGIREMVETIGTENSAIREENAILKARLDDAEKKIKDRSDVPTGRGGVDPEEKNAYGNRPVSMGKIIRALATKDWKEAKYEEEIVNERWTAPDGQVRTLNTTTVGAGGAFVPPEYLPDQFVDLLRNRMVCEQLGADVWRGLTGSPVTFPRQINSATAYWVEETHLKTESDPEFERVSMQPNCVAAITPMSNLLVMQANPSIEQKVQEDLTAVVGRAIDLAALQGTGGVQPLGIINTPGVGTYTLVGDIGAGATPVAADINGIEYTFDLSNDPGDRMGWTFHSRTKNTLKGLRTDSGAGVGTGEFFRWRDELGTNPRTPPTLDGMSALYTNAIPINLVKGASVNCSYIVFGNWDNLIIGYWGGLNISVNTQADSYWKYNIMGIKVETYVDVAVKHPAAFIYVDGVRP